MTYVKSESESSESNSESDSDSSIDELPVCTWCEREGIKQGTCAKCKEQHVVALECCQCKRSMYERKDHIRMPCFCSEACKKTFQAESLTQTLIDVGDRACPGCSQSLSTCDCRPNIDKPVAATKVTKKVRIAPEGAKCVGAKPEVKGLTPEEMEKKAKDKKRKREDLEDAETELKCFQEIDDQVDNMESACSIIDDIMNENYNLPFSFQTISTLKDFVQDFREKCDDYTQTKRLEIKRLKLELSKLI